MSEQTPMDPKAAAKAAKAQAVAAKAVAKASRPWFKKKRFMIPIGIFVLGGIGSAMGGSGDTGAASSNDASVSASESAAPEETTASVLGIGDKASDGKFTFVVKSMKCGLAKVGEGFTVSKAQGQYCTIDVSITNTGDEPQTMISDNQVVFDSEGREFAPDSGAMMFMEGNTDVWLGDINPGNTVKGTLVYDMPKGVNPVSIELHDSIFSDGISVELK